MIASLLQEYLIMRICLVNNNAITISLHTMILTLHDNTTYDSNSIIFIFSL